MKNIFICLILVVSLSCRNKCNNLHTSSYDIQIDYLGSPSSDLREMKNDSLYILFDGNYNEDTVRIMINNNLFKELILTTDDVVGIAEVIKTIKYEDVKNVGLRINNGKLIFVEPENRHYNIRLNYLDSLATIKFYRRFPGFM